MDTKEKIIGSSLKLFLVGGYDGFSMREVSREAGIKQPGLYYYFDDKLSLFKECVNYFFENWYSVLPDYFSEGADIENLIKNTCISIGTDREIIKRVYGVETETGQYRIILDIIKYCPECLSYMNKFNESFFSVLNGLTAEAKKQGIIRKECPRIVYILC